MFFSCSFVKKNLRMEIRVIIDFYIFYNFYLFISYTAFSIIYFFSNLLCMYPNRMPIFVNIRQVGIGIPKIFFFYKAGLYKAFFLVSLSGLISPDWLKQKSLNWLKIFNVFSCEAIKFLAIPKKEE